MKESEIRPEALLKRYLELSTENAERCSTGAPREAVSCVVCDSSEYDF